MDVVRTNDRDLLREVFRQDPIASMYMAGDLDEPLYSQCEWFAAKQGGKATAILLIFWGLSVPAVLAAGNVEGIQSILSAVSKNLPDRFYTKLDSQQYNLFGTYYDLNQPEPLVVMSLEAFVPLSPALGVTIRILDQNDVLADICSVYEDYPGNFFEPAQITQNLYCGAWVDGVLSAIAGTHAFAPRERVAVLGNVVTAAAARRRGLCRQTCSFLVEELQRRGCEFIGLHVADENQPAIRCYRSIGFGTYGTVLQLLATRRTSDD